MMKICLFRCEGQLSFVKLTVCINMKHLGKRTTQYIYLFFFFEGGADSWLLIIWYLTWKFLINDTEVQETYLRILTMQKVSQLELNQSQMLSSKSSEQACKPSKFVTIKTLITFNVVFLSTKCFDAHLTWCKLLEHKW